MTVSPLTETLILILLWVGIWSAINIAVNYVVDGDNALKFMIYISIILLGLVLL